MSDLGVSKSAALLLAASARLKKDSPRMSQNAIAAKLEISPSYWSKVLRGEKPLTKTLLPKVVRTLKLDVHQTAELQRMILRAIEENKMSSGTGIRTSDEKAESPVANYQEIGREHYWMLEKWYIIPLLNMITLANFSSDVKSTAQRLRISVVEVNEALERMIDTGLITKTDDSQFRRTERQMRFPTRKSHPSIRQFHESMIQRAQDELAHSNAEQRFEERLISSISLAGSPDKIKEAKLILEEAMYKAANLLSGSDSTSEIYQLNVQLFPLTK